MKLLKKTLLERVNLSTLMFQMNISPIRRILERTRIYDCLGRRLKSCYFKYVRIWIKGQVFRKLEYVWQLQVYTEGIACKMKSLIVQNGIELQRLARVLMLPER